jgi:hypothetical protein
MGSGVQGLWVQGFRGYGLRGFKVRLVGFDYIYMLIQQTKKVIMSTKGSR